MALPCGKGAGAWSLIPSLQVDETVMLRQLLEGLPVPVHVQDSYSSVAEVRCGSCCCSVRAYICQCRGPGFLWAPQCSCL